MADAPETLHATAIALGAHAALLRGPSGIGKSDLALRCLLRPPCSIITEQAVLVADDRVSVSLRDGSLIAQPPATIAGLIEVRGLGVYRLPFKDDAVVKLIIDLTDKDQIERLPDDLISEPIAGVKLPLIRVDPHESSAAEKVLLALSLLQKFND